MTMTDVTVRIKHPLDMPKVQVADLLKKAIVSGLTDAEITHEDLPDDEDAKDAVRMEIVSVIPLPG